MKSRIKNTRYKINTFIILLRIQKRYIILYQNSLAIIITIEFLFWRVKNVHVTSISLIEVIKWL